MSITVANANPGDAGELGIEDVDPTKLEFMIMFGKAEEAIEEGNRMLAGLRPNGDPLVLVWIAEVLIRLCDAHAELGQYKQAEAACLEAEATVSQDGEADALDKDVMARAQAVLASAYERAQEPRAAIEARRRQFELTEVLPENAAYRSGTLLRIADLHLVVGEREEAELYYREALELTSQIPKESRWEGLSAYRSLAALYRIEERHSEAEAILNAGLAEAKSLPETPDWYTASFLESLGWTYFLQGRYPEARAAARSALERYQREDRDNSLYAAEAMLLLARVEIAEVPGSREATRLLIAVLEMPDEDDESPHLMKALARVALAEQDIMAADFAAAEQLAREGASAIGETISAAGGPAYRIVALALQGQGRHEESVTFAQKAYATEQQVLPHYHSEIGETLALLVELYEALDKPEDAAATQKLIEQHRAARAAFEQAN